MDNRREQLRDLTNGMCKAVDDFAARAGLGQDVGQAAKGEMIMFLMYLAASDGTISWDEVRYIGDICGFSGTPNQVGKAIREKNLYSREFEQRVPICLRLMVELDKFMKKDGDSGAGNASVAVIETFRIVGAGLINLNSPVCENSINDHRIYIHMMEEYKDNKLGLGPDATGFVKEAVDYTSGFYKV